MRTALAVLLVVLTSGQAGAYCLTQVSGSSPYVAWSWTPVQYRVSSNLTDAPLLGAIDAAFATWSAVSCSTLKLTKGAQFTPCLQQPCSTGTIEFTQSTGTINIFWYSSPTGYPTNPQYVAYMYFVHDGQGKIVGGSIALNAFNYKWNATGGSAALMTLDLQNELTAFIGHVIGLDDSNVPGATMYPGISYGDTSKRSLAQDDINALVYLYKVSSCPAPPAPGPSGCSTPPVTPDAGVPDGPPAADLLPPPDLVKPPDLVPPLDLVKPQDQNAKDLAVKLDSKLLDGPIVDSPGAGDGSGKLDASKLDGGKADSKTGKDAATDAGSTADMHQGDLSAGDGVVDGQGGDSGPLFPPTDDGCCRVGHGRDVERSGLLVLLTVGLLLWIRRRGV